MISLLAKQQIGRAAMYIASFLYVKLQKFTKVAEEVCVPKET
jgi:hypothetical protein